MLDSERERSEASFDYVPLRIQITLDVKREIKRVPLSAQAVLLLLLSFEDSFSFCYLFPSHPS